MYVFVLNVFVQSNKHSKSEALNKRILNHNRNLSVSK